MNEFLRDYGALIAPVAAIINGFIAVVIAQFFKERPLAKVLLVVAAGVLGAAAISATFYNQRQIVAERATEKQKRAEIRVNLGQFIKQGNDLLTQCTHEQEPPPNEAATTWAMQVEQFLSKQLDASYVERFRSSAGLPLTGTTVAEPAHYHLWNGVYARVARLEQFIISEEIGR